MALGALIVIFFLVRMSVPDSFVETILIDRAVGVDRVLIFSVYLGVTGFAGGIFQCGTCLCEQY